MSYKKQEKKIKAFGDKKIKTIKNYNKKDKGDIIDEKRIGLYFYNLYNTELLTRPEKK